MTARERALERNAPLRVKNVATSNGPKTREEYLAAEVPLPVFLLRPGDIIERATGLLRSPVIIDVDPRGTSFRYTTFVDRSRTRLSQRVLLYYVRDDQRFRVESQTDLALPIPSDDIGTDTTTRTTAGTDRQKEGGQMATVVKRSTKKDSAKPSKPAKSAPKSGKRTQADIDAMVPKFLKAIKGGATMRAVKQEFGFSDDGPIRAALYRAGYTSKGEKHGETAGSIDASKAPGKKQVVKLRSEGAGWYRLAYLTGLSEPEVKKLVSEAGGPTGRVYASGEGSGSKSAAAEPAKGSGKRVTRRATKADPSK